MRRKPRQRRTVSPGVARLLPLAGFRHSFSRDAYVLRVVGGRFGPVLRSADSETAAAPQARELDEITLSPEAASRDLFGSRG